MPDEGADELINYGADDLRARVKEITAGKGMDVVYDPVGGAFSEKALRDMAWNGRFLVMGFATGDSRRCRSTSTLLKNCSIVGVFWLAFTKNERARASATTTSCTQLVQAGSSSHTCTRRIRWNARAGARRSAGRNASSGKVVPDSLKPVSPNHAEIGSAMSRMFIGGKWIERARRGDAARDRARPTASNSARSRAAARTRSILP